MLYLFIYSAFKKSVTLVYIFYFFSTEKKKKKSETKQIHDWTQSFFFLGNFKDKNDVLKFDTLELAIFINIFAK